MNEQRIFEEYSFTLKSQLNQFTYWFTELTPIQQMICFNLSMSIVNDSSFLMNESYFKNILHDKTDMIKNANSLLKLREVNFNKISLVEFADWIKLNLPCFRSSKCPEESSEVHAIYLNHISTFFSLLTQSLLVKEQFNLLENDIFVQDVETIIGIFLLHPDFKAEEKQTITDHLVKAIRTIDPQQGQPRLHDVERFLIYLLSLNDEVLIFTSCFGNRIQQNQPNGQDMTQIIKDLLNLPKIQNSGYSSLRSSGFISECEISSSQASIPCNFMKQFPFRRESDDRYSYLMPGSYSQRILPSRRQSASPFFVQHQGSSASTNKNGSGNATSQFISHRNSHQIQNFPTMSSVYNFSDYNSHSNGNGNSNGTGLMQPNPLEIHRELYEDKKVSNPHIEIHVLPESSSDFMKVQTQQSNFEKNTIESIDSELTTRMIYNNHGCSVPNQCYLQPNSPLGGLSRASSGSFQSSDLNSSESPYFMSIFEHGNLSPNMTSSSVNIKSPFEIESAALAKRNSLITKSSTIKQNHTPGMQNIFMWLKNLRLHKYTEIFRDITYDELMNMTDFWLDNHNVTQGAKNKILINIAKLHDRATLLETMKSKLTNMRHNKQYSNILVSLKGCLSDLRQVLLSPIHPFLENLHSDGYSRSPNGLQPDYRTEDLPSAIVECILKVTDFCCHLDSVDYDSQARLLEIYNLIAENEAFTMIQKETILECHNQILSVHGTESLQGLNSRQLNRSSPRSGVSSNGQSTRENNLADSLKSEASDVLGKFSQNLLYPKKIIERTYSEPYRGNNYDLVNLSNNYLMSTHDTMDCNNTKMSNLLFNHSNMSSNCSDNFSDNTISHIGSSISNNNNNNGMAKEASQWNESDYNQLSNGTINGPNGSNKCLEKLSDSTALINHNLDQLTKKVTQLAIQESDNSE